MKDDTVDLDALEKIIIEEREKTKGNFFLNDQKIFWAMFYTIPIFHNPTGMTLLPGNLNIVVPLYSFLINKLKFCSFKKQKLIKISKIYKSLVYCF